MTYSGIQRLGVPVTTFEDYKKKYPEFLEAIKRATRAFGLSSERVNMVNIVNMETFKMPPEKKYLAGGEFIEHDGRPLTLRSRGLNSGSGEQVVN